MKTKGTSRFIGAFAALTVAVACGKGGAPVDDGLARDLAAAKGSASSLELAPRAGASQVVVSAIEGGPQAAPARATRAPIAKPTSHPAAPRIATRSVVPPTAPVPHASVVESSPTTTQRATSERAPDPAPLPPAPSGQGTTRERQRGTYSTEAEILRRMPWIRP
jgi:hypothetical protein